MTSKLTQKQQDELFATLQSATKKTQDIRAEKTKLNNPAINLSNDELFNDHVKCGLIGNRYKIMAYMILVLHLTKKTWTGQCKSKHTLTY